jgi:hypothetical protein
MANVGYFKGKDVYSTEGMSDIRYDSRGHITEFKTNVVYIYITSQDYRTEELGTIYAKSGFCEKDKFLEYLVNKISRSEIAKYFLDFTKLSRGVLNDVFKTVKLNTEEPFDNFCKVVTYEWNFDSDYELLDVNFNVNVPASNYPGYTKVERIMQVHPVAKSFFLHKYNLFLSNITNEAEKKEKVYILTNIGLFIHWINNDIFTIFQNNSILTDYIDSQNTEWTSLPIFNSPSLEDFKEYNRSLSNFYNSVYSNQLYIINASNENKLYWLAHVLSSQALQVVSVEDKVTLLRYIAKGTIIGEIAHVFGEVDEEEFVLKIINSVTNVNNQIDYFLSKLKEVNYNGVTNDQSLFEILYSNMNDRGLGKENLKEMMNLIYQKWLLSSSYPYNLDGTVKDDLVNNTIYNAKPINVDYKASDFLWIFNSTNYDFDFKGKQIEVIEDGYEINPVTGNAIPKEFTIGTYGLFQAITIKNTDDNTENTKFITTNIGGEQKAILPIFYLKYIDDKKFTENLVTAAELTFDLALTATGIGNLAKLRHLKHITPFGRVALGLEAPGANLIRYELAQGVAGLIEVSSSVASILLSYGNTYQNTYCNPESQSYNPEKCEFYTKLDVIVNVMQIFSGGLDYATSRQLKNASRRLLDGPIPNDFNADALTILRKFAGDPVEIKEVFRVKLFQQFGDNPTIWQKLDNLPTSPINKQEMFILDFERATNNVLNELNINNGELIDYWNDIKSLTYDRQNIAFLSSFKRFVLKNYEHTHITDIHNSKTPPAFKPIGGHAYKNILSGDILNPSTSGLPPNMQSTMTSKNGHITYSPIFIKKPPGATGGVEYPIGSGTLYYKKPIHTIWNPNWNDDRIKEEMAFAFSNKKIKSQWRIIDVNTGKKEIIYKSKLTDGTKVEIKMTNFDNYLGQSYNDHLNLFTLIF